MLEHLLVAGLIAAIWLGHEMRMHRKFREQQREILRLRRREAELKARAARRGKRLDAVLASINEAVLRLNLDGSVRGGNARACQAFGLASKLPTPQPLSTLYRDPDWHAHFNRALQRLPQSSELPRMHVNGQVFLPRLTMLGKKQLLLVCMDITDEERLRQQRSQFLSNLMHDLKTPLTSMLGYARSMEAFADDEALRREAVRVIIDEARHINSLLESLLCIDQIEHGRPLRGECDIAGLLPRLGKTLEPQMQEKALQLHIEPTDQTASVALHEVDCTRVIGNILGNAVRYSKEGGRIDCRIEHTKEAIELHIIDQGIGIPEADLPHVCERFYRVDGNRRRGGHGLGLAIAHEILTREGGGLRLQHNQPCGIHAIMRFPRAYSEPEYASDEDQSSLRK